MSDLLLQEGNLTVDNGKATEEVTLENEEVEKHGIDTTSQVRKYKTLLPKSCKTNERIFQC